MYFFHFMWAKRMFKYMNLYACVSIDDEFKDKSLKNFQSRIFSCCDSNHYLRVGDNDEELWCTYIIKFCFLVIIWRPFQRSSRQLSVMCRNLLYYILNNLPPYIIMVSTYFSSIPKSLKLNFIARLVWYFILYSSDKYSLHNASQLAVECLQFRSDVINGNVATKANRSQLKCEVSL